MKRRITAVLVAAASTMVLLPGVAAADVAVDGYSFRVLDEKFTGQVDGVTGVDYRNGSYVLVAEDTTRAYTADLALTGTGFGHVRVTAATKLREADGTQAPQGGAAVRVDPADGSLLWANPGKRTSHTLIDSTVTRSAVDGTFVAQHPAAPYTAASATAQGIRDEAGIAGLTMNTGGTLAVSALAKPLLQDGPATVRLSFANRSTGSVLSQLAYDLDPAPRRGTNEVAEILAVDASHYLVLEHATDAWGRDSVRLYEASTVGARSVLPFAALSGADYTPVTKRLLVDFADLDLSRVTDLQSMTWGPDLATGERTLVLASDNDCEGRTQLIALAVTLS